MNLQNKRNISFFAKCFRFVCLLVLLTVGHGWSQDSTSVNRLEEIKGPTTLDTLPPYRDSLILQGDSIFQASNPDALGINYSKDTLDAPVDYNAQDSMIYDIANKKIHLYGEANVKYTTINLKADYIIFDWESNIVTAEGLPDSTGRMAGFPEFEDGSQSFTAKKMQYNFKERKVY